MGNLAFALSAVPDPRIEDQQGCSGLECSRYEARMVESARAIVAGESRERPNVEQLRVLLEWLDGSSATLDDTLPF